MTTTIYVVVGGQYGSEGKGAVAARIASDSARRNRPVVGVRVGGPNAGHTVLGTCGTSANSPECGDAHGVGKHPWRLRQVPVAAVADRYSQLLIAAGSEIDPQVLADEIRQLNAAGYKVSSRLHVDQSATVIEPQHVRDEQADGLQGRIGSTAKGIGAARAERAWRRARTWQQWVEDTGAPGHSYLHHLHHIDGAEMLRQVISTQNADIVVEGTQGYGLGVHTGAYPQTTSGDCRAIDFLAQAGISPWQTDANGWRVNLEVVIAVRPHPIRVAGNSGPLAGETTWSDLGLPEEHTTVTQKVRRVGAWDPGLVRDAIHANGGPHGGVVWLALTMMDSVCPALSGLNTNTRNWANDAGHSELMFDTVSPYLADLGIGVQHLGYVGTGPDTAVVNTRMYE